MCTHLSATSSRNSVAINFSIDTVFKVLILTGQYLTIISPLFTHQARQCVECAIIEIYLLLVARNILKYISLLFNFLVLRHIALLVASLVVAILSLVLYTLVY